MAILAMGKDGKVYVTSPDREDGGGYGHHPKKVQSRPDLALGSAYKKANEQWQKDVINLRRTRMGDIARENEAAELRAIKARVEQERRLIAEKLQRDPQYREAMTRRAAAMGCACSEIPSTELSGNGLTANGQQGYKGMDRDQKMIHNNYHGLGDRSANRRVNSDEVAHKRMNQGLLERALLREKSARASRQEAFITAPKQALMGSRPALRPLSSFAKAVKRSGK